MAEIMIRVPVDVPLSQCVRGARKAQRWSQLQLAQKSGYCRCTIARIEAGTHEPSLECMRCVLGALGLELVSHVQEIIEGAERSGIGNKKRLEVEETGLVLTEARPTSAGYGQVDIEGSVAVRNDLAAAEGRS
jgi:transcriptional regulator with XRE-family HTH domain